MLISALQLAGHASSGIASAIAAANAATDKMIDGLKVSDNTTVNRIGRVLEGTKAGFLIGYISPSILTAVGVALTTGDLVMAVGGGIVVLSNPVAGICAAVGAVYFGWNALGHDERKSILEQVGEYLKVGHEMIKAVINLALRLMTDLLSSDNLNELKKNVSDAAESVGRKLSQITHSAKDTIIEAIESGRTALNGAGEAAMTATTFVSALFKRRADRDEKKGTTDD
ncbi:hypothetical protein OAD57_04290 [Porticoccaceae bacterium]|nr:hypothetical protein [Porticoccaceae bacterium]